MSGLELGLKELKDKTSNINNTRRCILISDGESKLSEKVNEVKGLLMELNCKMEIFGIAFGLESKSTEGKNNEEKLKDLVKEAGGEILAISQAMELLSECNRRTVRQTTKYRGGLSINDMLTINVFVYSKTQEEKLPSLKKVSNIDGNIEEKEDGDDNEEISGNVKMDRIYRPVDDPDNEVTEEYRIKAYRYGKDYIPFTFEDESNMKYVSEKEMKILGFTDKNNIPRYCYMSSCDIAVSAPMDKNSEVGLSSLIEACKENNKVIIVRFVKRNKSDPLLCVLSPYIEYDINNNNEIIYECFLINELPFGDDCRDYEFNSIMNELNNINSEEDEIIKKLIEDFDLSKMNNNNEILNPDRTFNPTIQRFNKCLQKRCFDSKSNIPPLDGYMLRNYELINDVKKKRKSDIFDKMKILFPIEVIENNKNNNKKLKYWNKDENDKNLEKVELAGDNNINNINNDNNNVMDSINENLFEYEAKSVSTMNPIEDFNSMIKSLNVELYKVGINGMIKVINQFMEEGNIIYDRKSKECLKAFRDGCINIGSGNEYNELLKNLKEKYSNRIKFFIDLKLSDCGLISVKENNNVKISESEATEFWSWLEPKNDVVSSLSSESEVANEEDSLLDDLL